MPSKLISAAIVMSRKSSKNADAQSLKRVIVKKARALSADDSVQKAGEHLRARDTDAWPVEENSKLVGMVKESNPDWKIGGEGHDPKSWKVGEIMSRELIFCYEDEDCAKARRLMQERGLRYLPVVDREMRIVGIFSREEIEAEAPPAAREKPTGKP